MAQGAEANNLNSQNDDNIKTETRSNGVHFDISICCMELEQV